MAEIPTLYVCHGDKQLHVLKPPDGTMNTHSRAILPWIAERR